MVEAGVDSRTSSRREVGNLHRSENRNTPIARVGLRSAEAEVLRRVIDVGQWVHETGSTVPG
jgi:hypothetical protein